MKVKILISLMMAVVMIYAFEFLYYAPWLRLCRHLEYVLIK